MAITLSKATATTSATVSDHSLASHSGGVHGQPSLCARLSCPLAAPADDPSYYVVGGDGVAVLQDLKVVDTGQHQFSTLRLPAHSLDIVVAHYRSRTLLWYDSGKKVGGSACYSAGWVEGCVVIVVGVTVVGVTVVGVTGVTGRASIQRQ